MVITRVLEGVRIEVLEDGMLCVDQWVVFWLPERLVFCCYERGVFSLSSHQSESLLGHPWVTCAVVYAWVLHLVAKSCDGLDGFLLLWAGFCTLDVGLWVQPCTIFKC